MASACFIRVRGIVQGVGFRPFVYRLARAHDLAGWVLNGEEGVEIHAEGRDSGLAAFLHDLKAAAPQAARISELEVSAARLSSFSEFTIRESECKARPTVRISPDLPVCKECLVELVDSSNPRHLYPYINCTNCGPRYSIIRALPYDRCNTTMSTWPLDASCHEEYEDPDNRRFHAQPVACAQCGPHYVLQQAGLRLERDQAIARTAELLAEGAIVAIKGLGGYHLACDALNAQAAKNLRERKY